MIKIKKIKEFLKRLVWIIGRNAFVVFVILFFLALILGGFIFYKYSFLAEKSEPQITERPLRLEETIYQKILKEWQIRQQKFKEAEEKEYPDLFSSRVVTSEETEELTE